MLSFAKTLTAFPSQIPRALHQHPFARSLVVIRSNSDNGNNFTSGSDITLADEVEIRFRRGSRKRRRKEEEEGATGKVAPKQPAKDWDSMTLTEKAVELYVGEKGLLFWLNKFAYASIFIVIGGWIVFRRRGTTTTTKFLGGEGMDVLGLLRIRVRRGINLAVRDTVSSDPYCVISCGTQRVKTRVVRGNCNPVWNEELTIYIKDLNVPIKLNVYDKDTFTVDDSMGSARIDISSLIECLRMGLESLPDGTKVQRVEPSQDNFLADESAVVWTKGKMTQDMILRLQDVE